MNEAGATLDQGCPLRTAADWIDRNQIGRRNLNPGQMTLIVGRIYRRPKKLIGGRADRNLWGGQNDQPKTTAPRIAQEHGITEATVRRAGRFVGAVEKLKAVDPDIEKGWVAACLRPHTTGRLHRSDRHR